MTLGNLIAIGIIYISGLAGTSQPVKPAKPSITRTLTCQNPYPGWGEGVRRVRVRVRLGNPRVTRDNHYPQLASSLPAHHPQNPHAATTTPAQHQEPIQ